MEAKCNYMKEASFYEKIADQEVQCHLCPHNCLLGLNERGNCDVRKNIDGILISENYGLCSGIQSDPIEKKPLYHFYPGRQILSIGSIGCNLECIFCQNCEISQTNIDTYGSGKFLGPEQMVEMVIHEPGNLGIAFTYNEPTVYFEYMLEVSSKVKEEGFINVMVSNGFINPEPLQEIMPYIDAFNIDLKSFSETFYWNITNGHLKYVKNTLIAIKKAGKHLEVTNLLIPTLNDDPKKFTHMVRWIHDELGRDTVLHLSRYFPAFKSTIQKTSLELLFKFCEIARKYLDYVYLGNVTGCDSQNTICSKCGKIVISRYGYFIQKNGIDEHGDCIHCKNNIVKT